MTFVRETVTKRKTSVGRKTMRRKATSGKASGKSGVKIIDAYVQRRNAKLKPLADQLRQLVKRTVPESREAINPWGIPTFDFDGPLCLMMVGKYHVTLGFPRGTSLTDPMALLEGTGKNLRHVKLKEAEQLRDPNLRRLILEAAALNRETPLTPSMRVKKATQRHLA
jgi:hypothetical protein